jgi:micrococcal nuclease
MKHLIAGVIVSCFSFTTFSQTKIELKDISSHINDSVEVQGKIFGIKYLESAKNSPTFISVGGAYPNQLLTIVIWGDVRKNISVSLDEAKQKGNIAWATGKLESYKGKPQIVISDPKQLDILIDTYIKKD